MTQTFARYKRDDMIENLLQVTRGHTGARKPVMWVCDCGCDIAQWFLRTDAGLAFTQQAWPMGVEPIVIGLQTRDEVEHFVRGTVETFAEHKDKALKEIRHDVNRAEMRRKLWGK